MSREEKAVEKILEAISDVRVDVQLAGYILSGEDAEAKERLYNLVATAKSFDSLETEADEEEPELEVEEDLIDDDDLSDEWHENLEAFQSDSLNDSQLTQFLIGFFEDSNLFEYTDGMEEALCRRIGFRFTDGTIIWHGAGEGIILSHLTRKLEPSDWKEYKYLISFGTPTFLEYANGWSLAPNPEWRTLVDMVELMESRLDEKASVFVPLSYVAERNAIDGLEEYLAQAGVEEGDENFSIYEAAFAVFEKVHNRELAYSRDVDYVDAEDYLPEHSAYGKFSKFLDVLREENGWGVIMDECCGTCSGGSARDLRAEPGFENAPIFFTWSQNSYAYWGTSGWVSHQHYTSDENEIKTLLAAAEKVGLNVSIEDSHYSSDNTKVLSFS